MNALERRMVNILRELKEKHGAVCVRAEFEAEGTKLEELLRLKEISMAAGLGLMLKIGGCESIRDMLEARVVGVNYLVAPMVETGYALKKYLLGVQKVFPPEERNGVEILCNIETVTAVDQFDEMLNIRERAVLQGVVVERVDLCFSLGYYFQILIATFQQNPTGGVNQEYPWDHHQINQGLRRNSKPFYFFV